MVERRCNTKQVVFVGQFLVDFNGTQAAIRAGYSEKNASRIASELLGKPHVQEEIRKRQAELAKKLEIRQETVVMELARLGFSDMRNYVSWGPSGVNLKDSAELTEDEARAVIEVSETRSENGSTVKFKLADKKGPLELLGKHLGLLGKNGNGHEGDNVTNIQIVFNSLGALSDEQLRAIVAGRARLQVVEGEVVE